MYLDILRTSPFNVSKTSVTIFHFDLPVINSYLSRWHQHQSSFPCPHSQGWVLWPFPWWEMIGFGWCLTQSGSVCLLGLYSAITDAWTRAGAAMCFEKYRKLVYRDRLKLIPKKKQNNLQQSNFDPIFPTPFLPMPCTQGCPWPWITTFWI